MANVLLLDKNEPVICDNSLDLFLKTDPKRSSLYTNGAESPVLRVTLYRLHSPAGCNYQLLCVFDCQSRDFANKTGESEYSQEMVERSFWESKKIPKAYTRTLSLSTVQIVRHLQDFLFPQVSRLRELRSWIHDQIKFQSEQIKWTNYWNHFFI